MDVRSFLVLVSIVTVISPGCAHHGHGGGSDHDLGQHMTHNVQGAYRSALMQYIVTKGCHYLAGFMHSHYVHGHGGHKGSFCNWQNWVTRRTEALNVPNPLSSALISCGSSVSMAALDAPAHVLAHCNMTVHSLSHAFAIGKRHMHGHDHIFIRNGTRINATERVQSVSEHDPHYGTSIDAPEDHRHAPLAMETYKDKSEEHGLKDNHHGNDKHDNTQNELFPFPVQMEPPSPDLLKWCYSFSSYINNKYHFNEIVFVQKSAYWLEDIYQIAPKFGVPVSYAHALVGCGMDVALHALNAPSWQSTMYVRD